MEKYLRSKLTKVHNSEKMRSTRDADAAKETMYGYSDYGEMTKRDLYTGNKAGITALYG